MLTLLRSSHEVTSQVAAGYEAPAGHIGVAPNTGDHEVPAWTGPDAESLYPGWSCPGMFDVSGGWYDAGDYGKYTTSGGIAVWQLLGVVDLLDRVDTDRAIEVVLREKVLAECRWQLDWMLRMQVPVGSPDSGPLRTELVVDALETTRWQAELGSAIFGWIGGFHNPAAATPDSATSAPSKSRTNTPPPHPRHDHHKKRVRETKSSSTTSPTHQEHPTHHPREIRRHALDAFESRGRDRRVAEQRLLARAGAPAALRSSRRAHPVRS